MTTPIRSYRDLLVWQRSLDLVEAIYVASERWPASEQYGLTNQIRRAAVSIPSNIAEGQGRGGDKEFARFLSIARGSLRELETQLIIALRLRFLGQLDYDRIHAMSDEIGRLLQGLSRRLKLE